MCSLCQQLNACLMFLMMLQSIGPPSTLPQHASSRVGAQVQQSGTVTEHATQKPQQRSLWQPLQFYVSSPCFVIFLFLCPCFVIFLFVCFAVIAVFVFCASFHPKIRVGSFKLHMIMTMRGVYVFIAGMMTVSRSAVCQKYKLQSVLVDFFFTFLSTVV